MTGCRDRGKNIKNVLKMGFSPFVTPKNRALSLLYPYGAKTSCKKLEKTNELSLRYLKTPTDGRTTDHGPQTNGQGRLLWTQPGKPRVQQDKVYN